jgi:hypothetical protein
MQNQLKVNVLALAQEKINIQLIKLATAIAALFFFFKFWENL